MSKFFISKDTIRSILKDLFQKLDKSNIYLLDNDDVHINFVMDTVLYANILHYFDQHYFKRNDLDLDNYKAIDTIGELIGSLYKDINDIPRSTSIPELSMSDKERAIKNISEGICYFLDN